MTWQSISFRKRMLVIMTLSGLIELLILVAAGFAYLKYTQEQEMGQNVVELVENRDNVTYQAKFRELTEDERLGLPMRGGDNARALEEGEAYISTARGSLGYSVRGKAAVF